MRIRPSNNLFFEEAPMSRLPILAALVILSGVLMVGAGQTGGDKKEGGDPPLKPTKVSLPANWSKVGVAGEQKKKILQVRAKFAADIDKLRAQIEVLKKEMEIESVKLLTEDQKTSLRKLAADKIPDTKDKKPEEKKKPGDKN
jgi:hypothetical protein